jgi:DNA-binding NarL/FixJ family response regulator
MFGLLLHTPSLSRRFVPEHLDRLRQLEIPFRSLARRIERFRALEHQHDVLHQLLERQRGAFLLWDADGRLTWVSSAAQMHLDGPLPRTELEHAAALALRQLRRTDVSRRDALLGRPRQLRTARGAPLLVEFSWIATSDQRPWLLAEIKNGSAASALIAKLSSAETRVLRLLVRGLSNREASELLGVSGETVKTHVKRILSKLGVSSRAKAARIAGEVWAPPRSSPGE